MSFSASFRGAHTAVVTPFREGGIDEKAFEKLCVSQLGCSAGIVVGSDIGEGVTLEEAELLRLVQIAHDVASHAMPVLCHLDFSRHRKSDEFARLLIHSGANTLICRLPQSLAFGEDEAYAYLRRVSHVVDRPVIYEHREANGHPTVSDDKLATLYAASLIQGLILCDFNPTRSSARQTMLGDEFVQLVDDDRLAACHIAIGGQGWITATGNIAPKVCADLLATWNTSDVSSFRAVRDALSRTSQALSLAHPSTGLKAVLKHNGISDGSVRAPLRHLQTEAEQTLLQSLSALQALNVIARRGRD